jgi:CRP-like cAMP-binding protein
MSFQETLSSAGVDASSVEKSIEQRRFQAGEYVIRQGEFNKNIYKLTEGLIKLVYVTSGGSSYTKSFIDTGGVFASMTCTVAGEPARFSAVCLTPVSVEQLPSYKFRELTESDPKMLKFSNQMFRRLALRNEEREYDFLCLSAEERYEKFLDKSPELAGRLTQIEIAAYLGITPVSLSRIRASRIGAA